LVGLPVLDLSLSESLMSWTVLPPIDGKNDFDVFLTFGTFGELSIEGYLLIKFASILGRLILTKLETR